MMWRFCPAVSWIGTADTDAVKDPLAVKPPEMLARNSRVAPGGTTKTRSCPNVLTPLPT
jgi:hypothetical protein